MVTAWRPCRSVAGPWRVLGVRGAFLGESEASLGVYVCTNNRFIMGTSRIVKVLVISLGAPTGIDGVGASTFLGGFAPLTNTVNSI